MVRHSQSPDEGKVDLDSTDELPLLDVAAYEAALRSRSPDGVAPQPELPSVALDESRPLALTGQPPSETLRDVEAWIAAQNERARIYERTLAETQAAQTEAQARADNLILELEIARKSLQVALSRANDGERAAQDGEAALRAAESRTEKLQTDLEQSKQHLASVAERLAVAAAEAASSRESLTSGARERETLQQREAELKQTLEDRSNQVSLLESELTKLRIGVAESQYELVERSAHIAQIQQAHESQLAATQELTRQRDALANRVACILENAQSNEWKRQVWEGVRRELETQLADTQTVAARLEADRAVLTASTEKLQTELAARDATIVELEKQRAVQSSALEETAAARARDQESHNASAKESRDRAEKLAAEAKAAEYARRRGVELLAAREADLRESRGACVSLEQALQSVQTGNLGLGARITELEAVVSNLSHALQAQTAAATHANESLEARARELTSERARVAVLEGELQVATHQATDRSAAFQAAEAELAKALQQLTASGERLAAFERGATQQSEQLANMHGELSQARDLAERAAASRSSLEEELKQARAQLQAETERAIALDSSQRELALELERARGALGERDLQLRRLERYATSSAQVLSRIKVNIERENSTAIPVLPEASSDDATLVPLDDSDAPPLPLGRHTTIGRAPESDLRLKDSSVSRRHAVLTVGPKGAFIEDVRSVNGVTVNRQRIRHARLFDGDVIELGLRRFRFTTSLRSTADTG
jgi:chromosome segregation ATPase